MTAPIQDDTEFAAVAASRLRFSLAAGLSIAGFLVCLYFAYDWPRYGSDTIARGFVFAPTLLKVAVFGSALLSVSIVTGLLRASLQHGRLERILRSKTPPN